MTDQQKQQVESEAERRYPKGQNLSQHSQECFLAGAHYRDGTEGIRWVKASERPPTKGNLYHTYIRWKDSDMEPFPSTNNFYDGWEISEDYEVVEWLDEQPTPDSEVKERFKRPDDNDIVKAAILFNNGEIDKKKLSDMVGLVDFIIDRLYENGDFSIPSSKESK